MKLEKHRLIRAVSRTISCSISESLLHFNSFLAVYCSILYSVQCCQYNCQCINNSATFKFKKDFIFSFILLFRMVDFRHFFQIFCLNLHAYHILWLIWNLRSMFVPSLNFLVKSRTTVIYLSYSPILHLFLRVHFTIFLRNC